MMDRERPRASDSEGKIPEAWIGQEVMIETTEVLSSDLRAAAPVYLEDVNDRGSCDAGDAPPRPESVLPVFLPLERGGLDTPGRGGRAGRLAAPIHPSAWTQLSQKFERPVRLLGFAH
jgi:hypothetical protein